MPAIDTGSTAWMLVSAAMVLFMTPGLALFYAGMVRSKNVLSSTMHSLFAMGLVSVIWAVIGYSLAFGKDVAGLVGGLDALGLSGVLGAVTGTGSSAIPTSVFAMYQGMFAVITVGLITGAIAERMKFRAYVIFAALWALLVYSPLAHWVWGGGWLMKLGALDFAGGTVVHIASAAAALAAAIVLGKRAGYGTEELRPHNIPMSVLGAGILWFGWFGFNAGSALGSGELAGSAFMATNLSAAAGMLAWGPRGGADRTQTHGAGSRVRRCGRARRHHAGGRVRRPHARPRHRSGHRDACATSGCASRRASASTTRWTSSACTVWAAPSARS